MLKFTPEQIVLRAKWVAARNDTDYHLKWPNGGVDPGSFIPGHTLDGKNYLDCAGFVAWCTGYPRRLPGFPSTPSISGEYVNTDSMYEEAEGFKLKGKGYLGGQFFRKLFYPKPGCIVVYHSRRLLRFPFNPKVGHTGIVSWVAGDHLIKGLPYEELFRHTKVIHCSSSNNKKFGPGGAVAETSGSIWKGKKSLFLEFIGGNHGK